MYGLCKRNVGGRGGDFFSGDSDKHIRECFGRGESLSYRGSMRGTCREGSHTVQGLHKGYLKALRKHGLTEYVYWAGTST
jgi:hypothetical protein